MLVDVFRRHCMEDMVSDFRCPHAAERARCVDSTIADQGD